MSTDEITLGDDNFEQEVLKHEGPVLVDFWAPWCGPCKIIGPIVSELAKEYSGRLKVGKLNVDDHPQTPQSFGVLSIPTLFFFENGEVKGQVVGSVPKEDLVQKIETLLGSKK